MHDILEIIDELLRHPLVIGGFQISALVLARLLPVIVFTPMFGGQAIPARVRFGLAVVVSLGFLPGFLPTGPVAGSTGTYIILVAKEAVVGLTLAMYVLVLFQSIAAAGSLVGLSGGTTSSVVHDPYAGGQQSVIGNFKMQFAIVLFLTLGGHRVLF
ncbi:MAG: flagellar biosynthetic protein FliR, partial [Phycisphaerae bacterium]